MALSAVREGDHILAGILGGPPAIEATWGGDGRIEGGGRRVTWRPTGPGDQLRVAVRTPGGVTMLAVRR